ATGSTRPCGILAKSSVREPRRIRATAGTAKSLTEGPLALPRAGATRRRASRARSAATRPARPLQPVVIMSHRDDEEAEALQRLGRERLLELWRDAVASVGESLKHAEECKEPPRDRAPRAWRKPGDRER